MISLFEVARQAWLRQAKSSLYLIVLLVMVVVSSLFFFLPPDASTARGDYMFQRLAVIGGLTLFHPLVTMFFAIQVSQGDLVDRTATFLFTRPIPRPALLIAKWLAAVLLGLLVVVFGLLYLYGVFEFGAREWRQGMVPDTEMLRTFLLAGVMATPAYAAIGCLFGVMLRRPVILATIFIVGWEALLSRVAADAGVTALSVASPMRRWIALEMDLDGRSWLGRFLLGNMHGMEIELVGDPRISLLKFTLVCLGLAIFVYSIREYDARPPE